MTNMTAHPYPSPASGTAPLSVPSIAVAEILHPLRGYRPGRLDVDARDDATGPDDARAIDLCPAAVMVPIMETEDGPRLILTRRSEKLRHHAGQISFPGGKIDTGDANPWATALRETTEEIGLVASQFTPVAALDRYCTLTGYEINPWLALVTPPFLFRPQPEEVAEILTLPLSLILDPGIFEWQERQVANFRRGYHILNWQHHIIWGATAGILYNLSCILSGKLLSDEK